MACSRIFDPSLFIFLRCLPRKFLMLILLNKSQITAFHAIISSSQQFVSFCDSPAIIFIFPSSDPKIVRVGSPRTAPARCDPVTQDVAAQPSAVATRCCVMNIPCDPTRRGRKDRFAYSLTVVHFRKIANRQKIGSHENRYPVIY